MVRIWKIPELIQWEWEEKHGRDESPRTLMIKAIQSKLGLSTEQGG